MQALQARGVQFLSCHTALEEQVRVLIQRDKLHLAHATTLAGYAARQVRAGRRVGSSRNIQDVSSHYARLVRGIRIESLERFDSHEGVWTEVLIEDRRAGPAETAAARIDVACWLRSLSVKNRRIAQALAHGGDVVTVARSFGISASRISQLRRELKRSWNEFQGIDES